MEKDLADEYGIVALDDEHYCATMPEFIEDPDIITPASDPYLEQVREVKRYIVAIAQTMTPYQVTAVKMLYQGKTKVEVAETLGKAYATILRATNSEKAKQLRNALEVLGALETGASTAQRKNILWRIAHRNELSRPSLTISAVAELNKMDNIELQHAATTSGNTINIQINADLFPKGNLD